MRLFLAALLVFGGMLGAGSLLSGHHSPVATGVMVTGLMFFLVCGSLIVMNLGRKVRQDPRTFEERMREMEAKGLLVKTDYRARRAFEVEEFEDEGAHYFLELEDGRVLYVHGQHLYEYQPTAKRARTFPCTEFTLVRHKVSGQVFDIQCRGAVLEPEMECPCFSKEYFKGEQMWSDGAEIQERTYDQLKEEYRKG